MKINEVVTEKDAFYKEGVYISIGVDKETIDKIHEYMDTHLKELDCNKDEIHTTLIYSDKPYNKEIEPKEYTAKGTPTGFELFGNDKDSLVLLINSPELEERNEELTKQHGFVSDFAEYRPHITFSYSAEGFDISKLPAIDFDITFENETVAQLDTDWES